MNALIVFTDGACSGNPGPGGWATILVLPKSEVRELGGREARTTNNRMEMSAVMAALRALKASAGPIQVYTDSTYVISGITSWVHGWKRRGWKTAEGKPVLNQDLWEELDGLAAGFRGRLTWHYVRGHTGSPGNERCDEIAVAFSLGKHIQLYRGPLSGYPCEDILQVPADTSLPERSSSPKPKREGGFYLSYLDGRLERHRVWSDCQARVHGKSGALFKKVSSETEADEVRRRWGAGGSATG